MATAGGEFQRPPGFENDDDVDEAELAALQNFLIGSAPKLQPSAQSAPAQPSWKDLMGDKRDLTARRRQPPKENENSNGYNQQWNKNEQRSNQQWNIQNPPGLYGEETAQIEVSKWSKDQADTDLEYPGSLEACRQSAENLPMSNRGGELWQAAGSVEPQEIIAPDFEDSLLDGDTSFEDLGISENLLQGVYEMGFVKPSKIQAVALPQISKGQNMIGQAQNGSGKTATFSLALLCALDIGHMQPQALVLCPTRELARQVESVISELGKFLPVKTQLVVPMGPGERIPRNAECHVVIGTPGKVIYCLQKGIVNAASIKVFVLDEADCMLDQETNMGPQVLQIRKHLPENTQVLFFSATYPDDVRAYAEHLVPRATSIKVNKTELTLASVKQLYMKCGDDWDKFGKLSGLYGAMNVGQSVIFVNSKKRAFQLAKWMQESGFSVSLICGTTQQNGEERMDPATRDAVMKQFCTGVTNVLIATDVLARGIDVPQVTLVINYDLPLNYHDRGVQMETYLHRVGRTGRFGLKGISVNLVNEKEQYKMEDITRYFGCQIEEMDEDFDQLEERLKNLR